MFPFEGEHANKSYSASDNACQDEEGYTAAPTIKAIAHFHEQTTTSYNPYSGVPEMKDD